MLIHIKKQIKFKGQFELIEKCIDENIWKFFQE